MRVKLPEFAKLMGVTRQTALRWYHEGTIPYPTQQLGPKTILVDIPDPNDQATTPTGKTVAYCRVC